MSFGALRAPCPRRTRSTDWFFDPRRETERLRAFLEERRRLSAAEDISDWMEGDDYDVGSEDTEVTAQAIEELVEAVADSSGGEDVFVEVGDRVTYYLVDDPNERRSVLIVNSESNPKMGIVNEQTPLAQALLDLSPGDIGELEVAGQKNRQLRVLKVQRQEELLA